jgi:ribose transport system ATP-binding protein
MQYNSAVNTLPLVSMTGITKTFGAVKVLDQVDFTIYPGEVHILAGENGAGKSTLMKILAGAYADYQGRIVMEGRDIRPSSPLDANRHGIAAIHQELSLIPSMSVVDNLFLGHPVTRQGFVRQGVHRRMAKEALDRAGVDVPVSVAVEDLPISVQQLIEITKAIRLNARVMIMDEPSSALNAHDVEVLFSLVRQLRSENHGIIYITHRLEEIQKLADRITVLRDGKLVGSVPAAELPEKKLLQWMVGREMEEQFPRHTPQTSSEALRVEGLSVHKANRALRPHVDKVSLAAGQGEILGIGGLQGSGASELFLGLFGALPNRTEGTIRIDGRAVRIRSPRDAIANGIALLTNDRKATGLIPSMSVTANMCVATMGRLSRYGWRRPREEMRAAEQMRSALQLRAASLDMDVADLSGGNQQKVAIGKWLITGPRIMLLDEPTRGIDVGAKHEIYQLMNEWTARGISILLVTSEMPELLAMSDRIIVMHRGSITAEFSRQEATAEKVLEAAMGKTNGGNR